MSLVILKTLIIYVHTCLVTVLTLIDMSNVLQEQVSQQKEQGTFQSQGSKDILSEAIGKPDHKGRVLGVGGGHTKRTYFPYDASDATSARRGGTKEREEIMKAEVRHQVIAELQEEWVKREEQMKADMRAEFLAMFSGSQSPHIGQGPALATDVGAGHSTSALQPAPQLKVHTDYTLFS
jgi:hypothetical protein